MSSPATHGGAAVERIETHASIVFLAGERAWKLKRAVRYDYLDYSTAARRRAMCEAEVRINRRTAPALYRGVTAVRRQADGSLTLSGSGTPVEWLVEMARFDQACLFNRLAEAGLLPLELMGRLAQVIAHFHATADSRNHQGGWDAMRRVIDGNAAGFAHEGAGILDPAECARLTDRARFVLDRGGVLLDQRRDDGLVRQCHGDLHLRNIVALDGEPTLFDAIEFNEEISWIDVLYDLAFLLMDLGRLGLPHHANALWNGYLAETGDLSGLSLMPLFMSCRAAVMAKTTATAANLQTAHRPAPGVAGARQRLPGQGDGAPRTGAAPADCHRRSFGIRQVDTGVRAGAIGWRGSGAVVLRSDVIRKRLCGCKPLDRLGPAGYTDDVSRRVYATVMKQADQVVRSGYAAIADAVFADPVDRDAIQTVVRAAGAPFVGLWLEAAEPVLVARVQDARARCLRCRCRRNPPPGRTPDDGAALAPPRCVWHPPAGLR